MSPGIYYRKGDASIPHGDKPVVIAHICNNLGRWGAGFTRALCARSPEPSATYLTWARGEYSLKYTPPFELGQILICPYRDLESGRFYGHFVAHMVAQDGLRSARNPRPVSYAALRDCLFRLCDEIAGREFVVQMPRIGCGLGGGDWADIEPIIDATLVRSGKLSVFVYDL
jgi:O-acetyl-ADP-ribose deacetylase (regulator of RNase III)